MLRWSCVVLALIAIAAAAFLLIGSEQQLSQQAAALRAPSDVRIMTAFDPGHGGDWGWLKWIPHARSVRHRERDRLAAGPSLLLAPDRRLTHLTRALIRLQHGDEAGARADAEIVAADTGNVLLQRSL